MEYTFPRVWPDAQGEFFDRAQTFSATPGHNGWAIADTSAAGAPTYVNQDGGGVKLTAAATSEAENVCLYQGDVLPHDINDIQSIEFYAKVAGIDAVTTLVMGLGSARNDTPDSVATLAWFRMEGSASTTLVVVETDDGTTDNDDKATGQSLAAVYKKFVIDFTYGLTDVRFYIDDQRVAASTRFDMSAATGKVQPIFQIQKASGTGVPSVTVGPLKVTLSKQLY